MQFFSERRSFQSIWKKKIWFFVQWYIPNPCIFYCVKILAIVFYVTFMQTRTTKETPRRKTIRKPSNQTLTIAKRDVYWVRESVVGSFNFLVYCFFNFPVYCLFNYNWTSNTKAVFSYLSNLVFFLFTLFQPDIPIFPVMAI